MEHYIVPTSAQLGETFLFELDYQGPNKTIPVCMFLRTDMTDIPNLSYKTLREIAKRINIPGRKSMNKDTLVNEIVHRIIFD